MSSSRPAVSVLVAALLAACSTRGRDQAELTPAARADSSRVLAAELAARFGARPVRLEIGPAARLRLVYRDAQLTADRSAGPAARDGFAADSARFRQAFEQAAWLWARYGARAGVDTIRVKLGGRDASPQQPRWSEEFFFYPAQLRHPEDPPTLGHHPLGG
jgi:hypothetical protein